MEIKQTNTERDTQDNDNNMDMTQERIREMANNMYIVGGGNNQIKPLKIEFFVNSCIDKEFLQYTEKR